MRVLRSKKSKPIQLVPTLKEYFQAKLAAELGPHDVKRLIDAQNREIVILDVRSREGFDEGHVPGAVHIPLEELTGRVRELDPKKEYISYCWTVTCLLSAKASYYLASQGFLAREMVGGIEAWKSAGFPLEIK